MQPLPKRPRQNARRRRQSYHFAAARADHEATVVVDGLEHAAHHIAVDAHRDIRRPGRRRAPASSCGCAPARGPRPSRGRCRSMRPTAPGTASSASASAPSAASDGRGIGQVFGMRDDVDADADRQRVAAAIELRRFEQDAGKLGAIDQHVVRPFQLEAAAARCRLPAIDADADRCRSARRRQRIGQRQPGDEAERRGKPAGRGGRSSSSVAARLPCGVTQARPRRPRPAVLPLGDDPELARIAGPRSSSASCIGRANRLERFEPYPSGTAVGASAKLIRVKRRSWRQLRRQRADRSADQHVEQHERARQAEHQRAARPAIGWKPPTGSSKYMILTMRR